MGSVGASTTFKTTNHKLNLLTGDELEALVFKIVSEEYAKAVRSHRHRPLRYARNRAVERLSLAYSYIERVSSLYKKELRDVRYENLPKSEVLKNYEQEKGISSENFTKEDWDNFRLKSKKVYEKVKEKRNKHIDDWIENKVNKKIRITKNLKSFLK